jgi:adenosine deaminase
MPQAVAKALDRKVKISLESCPSENIAAFDSVAKAEANSLLKMKCDMSISC